MKSIKAFTLIELLVVISIIASLLSILTPALSKARNQARITVCLASERQIGTSVAMYQCEYKGYVPVILNRWIMGVSGYGAENAFLSVALRGYDPQTRSWPSGIADPSLNWSSVDYETYVEKNLPKYYVCPFIRNSQKGIYNAKVAGTLMGITRAPVTYCYTTEGYRESYEPGMWERSAANPSKPPYTPYRLGFPHGWAKYGALPWNRYHELQSSGVSATPEQIKKQPVKWDSNSIRRVGGGSPSNVTALMCTAGEHDHWAATSTPTNGLGIYERDSHKRGKTGGTNALFLDGHVDWVPGTQIGWR